MDELTSGGVATLDAPDTSGTSTEPAQGAEVEQTATEPQTAADGATPTTTQTPAAEINPVTHRENALIAQFFGLADADLSEFTPAARAKLVQQAEARLLDQWTKGDPAAPANPAAPAKAPQTQQHSAPATPFDLKPLLKDLEATDPELAPHVGKAMQAIVDHFAPSLARLGELEQVIGQIAPQWAQAAEFQQRQAVESFYGNLLQSEPGWKAILDGPEGAQIKDQAYKIGERIVQANPGMDHGQALKMGLLQASKIPLSQIAMKSVQGQITKRSKSITTPPGTAASRGASGGDSKAPQTTRERMLAAVARTAEANGMELKD